MKIKTIIKHSAADFDDATNQFNEENNVKFTQTHTLMSNGVLTFVGVMFYDG